MANPREVKNRLRGVRKTQQITRAMKMVAAVKLRHAQAALANGRPYAERMRSLAANLLARIDPPPSDNPFFSQRQVTQATPAALAAAKLAFGETSLKAGRYGDPGCAVGFAEARAGSPTRRREALWRSAGREKILFIIVAADRGLCGNMNTNIFRQVLRAIDDLNSPGRKEEKPEIHLFLIGRKAKDFFKARQNAQTEDLPYRIRDAINFAGIDAGRLGSQCCELYRKGEFDRIDLFYNESSSALQHRPVRTTLLPLNLVQMCKDALISAGDVLFEPACAAMLDDVICGCIISNVRKILMEAEVAEHAARMLRMDEATKNADDLISAMQLTMNKLRQLSITNELADITTGAEAVG